MGQASIFLRLLLLLLVSVQGYALDSQSFLFNETQIGEGDSWYLNNIEGNGYLIAYEAPGAFVPNLRDGSEYGYFVNQIRIYHPSTGKLYALYSDDIEMTADRLGGRGKEVSYGEIDYPSDEVVRVEIFWDDESAGYVLVDIQSQVIQYMRIDSTTAKK